MAHIKITIEECIGATCREVATDIIQGATIKRDGLATSIKEVIDVLTIKAEASSDIFSGLIPGTYFPQVGDSLSTQFQENFSKPKVATKKVSKKQKKTKKTEE